MRSIDSTRVAGWMASLTRRSAADAASFFDAAVSQPVVAIGRLAGPNASAALDLDAAVQQARSTGNATALADALDASPATGCAMLLTLVMQACNYNPAAPGASNNTSAYLAYVAQVAQCPLFTAQLNDVVNPNMSGDWGTVIDQIVGYYVGIDDADLSNIRASLWTLAQAASSSPSTYESSALFVQNTLNAGPDLVLYLYHGAVQMVTNVQHGGKHSPDTVTNNAAFQLYRNVFQFNAQAWPSYAAEAAARTNATLTSWLASNATPAGAMAANWHV